MKYLFFDLEYATSKGGDIKICEFGYVVTNENFVVQERKNLLINPNIFRYEWDWRVVKKILTHKIEEYEKSPIFESYYDDIVKLINSADYIFGHTLNGDAKALNCDCQRYGLPSIDFKFYDIKEFYKQYSSTKRDISVTNILNDLEIKGEEGSHDAEIDAVNTMYEFKAMLQKLEMTAEKLIEICPSVVDYNENYKVLSLEISRLIKEERMTQIYQGTGDNLMLKYSKEFKIFLQFIDNVLPTTKEELTMNGLKVSISLNYEETHYKQMLNIAQLLCNKGAQYILKAGLSDIFVTYDVVNDDGTKKLCSKLKYVKEQIENGANVKIISFNEFLDMLNLTQEQLDNLPMVSFECLYREDAIIKDRKTKSYLNKKKVPVNTHEKVPITTLGDLFGDYFEKIKKEEE